MLYFNMLVVFNMTGLFFYINHIFISIKSLAFRVSLTATFRCQQVPFLYNEIGVYNFDSF